MPEFSQNCFNSTTNSLSNLNDANSSSNLRCSNSAHNVSNEGILWFFKNVDKSSCNTSDLELLEAFLVGRFGGKGIGIKLFEMFSKTVGGSPGLWFPFNFRTGKPGEKCLTQTTVFGLFGILFLGMVFIHLCRSSGSDGSRYTVTFSFSERNWIYSQLHNTF